MQPIIELANVDFCYEHAEILEHINLSVNKGEFIGIIGPNGSGKTTLLKLMTGLLKPHHGTIKLYGQPIEHFKNWHKIAYIRQKATQFDSRFPVNVREVVGFARVGKADSANAIKHALELVDMLPHEHTLIADLSGGQQQRVLIAQALAREPELLILDEPTVGIDSASQQSFYQLLTRINKEHGMTLIIVSHDVDVIIKEVKRIICLNRTILDHCKPSDFTHGTYHDHLYGRDIKHIEHDHT